MKTTKAFVLGLLVFFSIGVWADQGILKADGSTPEIGPLTRPAIHVGGTFGSGTITWYVKNTGDLCTTGGWCAISGAAFTAADDVTLDYERPVIIKGTLSGATGPTLYWSVR